LMAMARPKVFVKHFIACRNREWDDRPGSDMLETLEGVGYTYRIPADAECPELSFFLYTRFYLLNGVAGDRTFSLEVLWYDAPGGPRLLATYPGGTVRFRADQPVRNVLFAMSDLRIPKRGTFEFRLLCRYNTRLKGEVDRLIANEYIRIV
jgi:hypothetical protein